MHDEMMMQKEKQANLIWGKPWDITVLATFGPATELRPDSRCGSDSDGWLRIQCRSEGKSRVVRSFAFVACGLIERVWLLWCTPVGLNLFEKPRRRLWTTWLMC